MAPDWMRLSLGMVDEVETLQLADALRISPHEAVGVLVVLRAAVCQQDLRGRIADVSDDTIERWARWSRKRGALARWIRAHYLDGEGRIRHWERDNGPLENRREMERLRIAEKRRKEREQVEASKSGVAQQDANNGAGVAQHDAYSTQAVATRAPGRNDDGTLRAVQEQDAAEALSSPAPATSAGNSAAAAAFDLTPLGELSRQQRTALSAFLAERESPSVWLSRIAGYLAGQGLSGGMGATVDQVCCAIDELAMQVDPVVKPRRLAAFVERVRDREASAPSVAAAPPSTPETDDLVERWTFYLGRLGWHRVYPRQRDEKFAQLVRDGDVAISREQFDLEWRHLIAFAHLKLPGGIEHFLANEARNSGDVERMLRRAFASPIVPADAAVA